MLEQLSYAEMAFLVTAAATNVLAFQPREDPMIAGLLDKGLFNSTPDADPSHEVLFLPDRGRAVVDMIIEERECPAAKSYHTESAISLAVSEREPPGWEDYK